MDRLLLQDNDPLSVEVTNTIRSGDAGKLRILLEKHEGLSRTAIETKRESHRGIRFLLHVATDWPGCIPNGREIIATLIAAGADVHARFQGGHAETPLHWAASNNNVEALDALLDGGADMEAGGSVIDGGSALSDAVAFGQWDTARRLVERGAKQLLWHAAALGNMGEVRRIVEEGVQSQEKDLTQAFWLACHGGQGETADYLLVRGADLNWVGYDGLTPLDAARRSGAEELAVWLIGAGALSASDIGP